MKRDRPDDVPVWRPATDITGVSASSLLDLKAAIAQEKTSASATKVRKLVSASDVSTVVRNKGVSIRAARDQSTAESESARRSWEAAQEKLRQKSLIYDKFVKGGVQNDMEDHPEFLVDFEQKNWEHRSQPEHEPQRLGLEFFHEDVAREAARERWEAEARQVAEEETAAFEKRRDDRIALSEVIAETRSGREKAQALQEQRRRQLELRKLQVQKKAEAQKTKAAENQARAAVVASDQAAEKERRKLHIKHAQDPHT